MKPLFMLPIVTLPLASNISFADSQYIYLNFNQNKVEESLNNLNNNTNSLKHSNMTELFQVIYLIGENEKMVPKVIPNIKNAEKINSKNIPIDEEEARLNYVHSHITGENTIPFSLPFKLSYGNHGTYKKWFANIEKLDLQMEAISENKNDFCQELKFDISRNGKYGVITLVKEQQFPKLWTETTCAFKVTGSKKGSNKVVNNTIILSFTHTVNDWASELGNGTHAQKTARLLNDFSPKAKRFAFDPPVNFDQNMNPYQDNYDQWKAALETNTYRSKEEELISDLSPFTGYIMLQNITLPFQNISMIPLSMKRLDKLVTLNLMNNHIEKDPNLMSDLSYIENLYLEENPFQDRKVNSHNEF